MKRQNLFYGFAHRVIEAERDSGLGFLLAALEFKAQLDKEKLFEDQANMHGRPRGL